MFGHFTTLCMKGLKGQCPGTDIMLVASSASEIDLAIFEVSLVNRSQGITKNSFNES